MLKKKICTEFQHSARKFQNLVLQVYTFTGLDHWTDVRIVGLYTSYG